VSLEEFFGVLFRQGWSTKMISEIQVTQRLHTWMLNLNTALLIVIIGKLFLGR
jgi:hypothetical protein